MGDYYDRQGKSMALDEWAKKLDDREYKVIEQVELENGVMVSTVWLGLDHGWGENHRPLIFESMIFGGPNNEDQYRYSTEAEAREGHARLVKENDTIVLTEVKDRKELE